MVSPGVWNSLLKISNILGAASKYLWGISTNLSSQYSRISMKSSPSVSPIRIPAVPPMEFAFRLQCITAPAFSWPSTFTYGFSSGLNTPHSSDKTHSLRSIKNTTSPYDVPSFPITSCELLHCTSVAPCLFLSWGPTWQSLEVLTDPISSTRHST